MKRPICEVCGARTRRKRKPNGLLRCRRERIHAGTVTVGGYSISFEYAGKHVADPEYPKTWGFGEPPRYPWQFGPMVGDGPVKTSAWSGPFVPKHLTGAMDVAFERMGRDAVTGEGWISGS